MDIEEIPPLHVGVAVDDWDDADDRLHAGVDRGEDEDVAAADLAMYQAKRDGRDRIAIAPTPASEESDLDPSHGAGVVPSL